MKTGVIKFNVRDRGRKHRGADRNFDTVALAALINGPAVQERVAKGDMLGFLGHGPREAFGLEPGEVAIVKDKVIPLERAIATTSIRAFDDGTIEHEAEFLDTALGRTALRMFTRKRGGFSSAISVREHGGRDVPIGFHGFDYVMEPNFSTNRGYALDGVALTEDERALVLDGVVRESAEAFVVLDGLYTSLQADYDRLAAENLRRVRETEELIDMLARRHGPAAIAEAKGKLAALDSVGFVRPMRGAADIESLPMVQAARRFDGVDLVGREVTEQPETAAERGLMRQIQDLTANILGGGRR